MVSPIYTKCSILNIPDNKHLSYLSDDSMASKSYIPLQKSFADAVENGINTLLIHQSLFMDTVNIEKIIKRARKIGFERVLLMTTKSWSLKNNLNVFKPYDGMVFLFSRDKSFVFYDYDVILDKLKNDFHTEIIINPFFDNMAKNFEGRDGLVEHMVDVSGFKKVWLIGGDMKISYFSKRLIINSPERMFNPIIYELNDGGGLRLPEEYSLPVTQRYSTLDDYDDNADYDADFVNNDNVKRLPEHTDKKETYHKMEKKYLFYGGQTVWLYDENVPAIFISCEDDVATINDGSKIREVDHTEVIHLFDTTKEGLGSANRSMYLGKYCIDTFFPKDSLVNKLKDIKTTHKKYLSEVKRKIKDKKISPKSIEKKS